MGSIHPRSEFNCMAHDAGDVVVDGGNETHSRGDGDHDDGSRLVRLPTHRGATLILWSLATMVWSMSYTAHPHSHSMLSHDL